MSMTAIHQCLVGLVVHCERVKRCGLVKGRGARRRGCVVVKLYFASWRVGSVTNEVSLVRMLRLCLEVKLPGPRLLEPVGTICHLTWQTRPRFTLQRRGGRKESVRMRCWSGCSARREERRRAQDSISPSLQHGVLSGTTLKPVQNRDCSEKWATAGCVYFSSLEACCPWAGSDDRQWPIVGEESQYQREQGRGWGRL